MAERKNLLTRTMFVFVLIPYDYLGSRKPITSNHLKAVTNDAENRTIIFTIAKHPKLGKLITVLSDNITQDISSFTQSMVSVHFPVGFGDDNFFGGFCVCFTLLSFFQGSIAVFLSTISRWEVGDRQDGGIQAGNGNCIRY